MENIKECEEEKARGELYESLAKYATHMLGLEFNNFVQDCDDRQALLDAGVVRHQKDSNTLRPLSFFCVRKIHVCTPWRVGEK
jgi:hypothetical protein